MFLAGFHLIKKTSAFMNNTLFSRVNGHLSFFLTFETSSILGNSSAQWAEAASTRRSCKYHMPIVLDLLVSRTQTYELDCKNQTPPTQTLHKEMMKWHEKQGLCGINLNYGWWQEISNIQFQEITILEATSIIYYW